MGQPLFGVTATTLFGTTSSIGVKWRTGSIYSGTKDTLSANYLYEKLATSVNAVEISELLSAASIGFVAEVGDTPADITSVAVGETRHVRILDRAANSIDYVAWKTAADSTLKLEQSRFK